MFHKGARTSGGNIPEDEQRKINELLDEFTDIVAIGVHASRVRRGIVRTMLSCSLVIVLDSRHLSVAAQKHLGMPCTLGVDRRDAAFSSQDVLDAAKWEFGFDDPFAIQFPAEALEQPKDVRKATLQAISQAHIQSEVHRVERHMNVIQINPIFGPASYSIDARLAFVLMPFTDELTQIYNTFIKPTIEDERFGLVCRRADDVRSNRAVIQDIWKSICEARLIVADLSGLNPNVMYELGIAHTLGKETLDLIPRKAMQMTGIKELAKLTKKHVRAADAAWDEYSDGTGLKYEVYTSNTPPWCKRGPGDLNRVVYGAPDEVVAKAKKPAQVKPVGLDFKVGGADLEVCLLLDKPEIMVGEPVYLSFQVRNRSDQDLQTVQGGDYRNRLGRPESYAVTVVDENGKTLPVIDAGQSMGGLTGPQKIPAKGTWVRRLFLPNWAKLTAAGDYTITCKTTLKISPHTPGQWDWKEKTTDLAVEVQAKLRVVPQDHQKMGVLIDRLGNTMLGKSSDGSDEATRSLSNIEDDRVIPFFNKALETKDYNLKFHALDALTKFKSDEALAGLKKGMTTQAADISNTTTEALATQSAAGIRHAAACALSQSPHPDAHKLLLSMWNDPYDGVRITVLHALGKTDTPESLELLKKMANDPDKIVRDEALRYLRLRTEKPKD